MDASTVGAVASAVTAPISLAVIPPTDASDHVCARCARLGPTCCERCEIVLTDGDIARITVHAERDDFWESRAPVDPGYLDQDDDPNWLVWTVEPDGTRRVLRRRDTGACMFLSSAGCTLPTETRPLICRLYPYQYTERGLDGIADGCPTQLIDPGRTILDMIGMNLADGIRWHRQLYSELRTRAEQSDPTVATPPHVPCNRGGRAA